MSELALASRNIIGSSMVGLPPIIVENIFSTSSDGCTTPLSLPVSVPLSSSLLVQETNTVANNRITNNCAINFTLTFFIISLLV